MKTYRVDFYRNGEDKQEVLGHVTVDDSGTDRNNTLMAKAFRIASDICSLADRVVMKEIKER